MSAHSVKVTPVATIVSSSAGAPATITTLDPHGIAVGDTVKIAGHTEAAINGDHAVQAVPAVDAFTIAAGGAAGAGGTVTRLTEHGVLTLDEAKLVSGLDWVNDPARDAMMQRFIAAATAQVEQDTGLALLAQVRDIYLDATPDLLAINLPSQCTPLQAVVGLSWIDAEGVTHAVPARSYRVRRLAPRTHTIARRYVLGRLSIVPVPTVAAATVDWPALPTEYYWPYVVRVVAGVASAAELPPPLVQAVGLLTAHYATAGRDLVAIGTIVADMPMGYAASIHPFCVESVA